MAVRLRHCCCGCSLKEGTIVIGVIFLLLPIVALACGTYYGVRFATYYQQKDRSWYMRPEVILSTTAAGFVLCVTELITSSLLLRGVVKYDRRLVMPWLVDNAIMCGLLFLIVVGGAISCVILTASQLKDDLTTLTYGFLILVPGCFVVVPDRDSAAQSCVSLSCALFQERTYICSWWCTVSTACYPCCRPRGSPFYWTASRTHILGMKMRVITLRQRIGETSRQRIGSQAIDSVSSDTGDACATCKAVSATHQSYKQMTIRVTN
ncbi:uncharacterized protein LOC111873974 isoform X1 [Cryptotermes secundus]|uniref:uncharacterized protein LOC111873974 isoform X1 n=1 Tax=Cryptotermes secundus TaxID=105785 RepID=UPI000CD7BED2|nr:uncharacterized protein LOC111873974 isoform X1 [Cryptotermes secundus]XP_023724860.1 uncharacterized protein LOC111873974 isoform X1 [Cryptotermes secundus]